MSATWKDVLVAAKAFWRRDLGDPDHSKHLHDELLGAIHRWASDGAIMPGEPPEHVGIVGLLRASGQKVAQLRSAHEAAEGEMRRNVDKATAERDEMIRLGIARANVLGAPFGWSLRAVDAHAFWWVDGVGVDAGVISRWDDGGGFIYAWSLPGDETYSWATHTTTSGSEALADMIEELERRQPLKVP